MEQTAKMKMNPQFKKKSIVLVTMVFLSLMFVACMTNDAVNLLSTYLPDMRGWAQTQIALPVTVGGWIAIPVALVCGTIVKRLGTFACLRIGYLLLGIALIVMAVTPVYAPYFVAVIASRSAQALIFFGALQVCADWYHVYRGRVLGIVTAGMPVSSSILIPILNQGIAKLGFAPSWIILCVIALVMAAAWFFMGKSFPEDYGWQQDGFDRADDELQHRGMADNSPHIWTIARMAKKKEFWILLILAAMAGMVNGAGLMQYIPVVNSAGIAMNSTMLIWSICNLAAIPMSYIAGVIDDKFGTKIAFIIVLVFTVVMPLSLALLLITKAFFFACLGGFSVGLLAGCLANMTPSMKTWAFGRKAFIDFNRVGQAVENVFQATGVTILALFFDLTGAYTGGFIFFAVLMAVMLILALTLKSHAPEVVGIEKAKADAGVADG